MDIISSIENTILSLKVQIGTLANGKPRYKTYSYSNIDTAATDADLYFVAKSLATLFGVAINKTMRQDICNLLEE